MNEYPDEIYRKIYEYINPISKKPSNTICNESWCHVCGEYILKDDITVQKPILSTKKYIFLCLNCFNNKLD